VDGITVFSVEAERIRRRHGELLAGGAPHAPGACAFLDEEGSCRIYADRPYVCRTQGLPLRWLEESGEEPGADIVERRDICPLNAESLPPSSLDEEECWQIGPAELRLGEIEERFSRGKPRRVCLRELFRRGS
jgi:Fe-S-cluster containining protein